jgi:hypothetical protein
LFLIVNVAIEDIWKVYILATKGVVEWTPHFKPFL